MAKRPLANLNHIPGPPVAIAMAWVWGMAYGAPGLVPRSTSSFENCNWEPHDWNGAEEIPQRERVPDRRKTKVCFGVFLDFKKKQKAFLVLFFL